MVHTKSVGIAVILALACSRSDVAPGADALQGPEAARRAIAEQVREPSSVENVEELAQLLQKLGPDAIPAVAPTILNPGETLDAPRALLLLQFWIDHDVKGAAEWIARKSPLGYRPLALAIAVEKIATSDPTEALDLVGRSHTADSNLLKPFVRGWVRSGRPGVEDWMRNLGYGFKRQKALGAFARAKIEKDGPTEVMAWFEKLPESDDGFREEAFTRLTPELTYADPAAGVAWYDKHHDGPNGAGLMMALVDAWVAVDGPAAMRWLSQQPAGKERDDAVLDGVRWWGMADVESLKRWGRGIDRDHLEPWFQPGLPIYSRIFASDEPLEGIRWAEKITDAPKRDLTMVQITRQWRATDAAAADAWLDQSPLSAEDRERARTLKAPGGPLQD